jgi:5-methylcytosine-specific restriction endonuclease McrA
MPPPIGSINNPAGKRRPQTDEEKKIRADKIRAFRLRKYLSTPFDQLGMENRRRRVFEEQDYKCNRCSLNEWLGQPLVLELEHKDGNNKNNSRDNLEGLCPNCHSLTSTWRGRNKK